MDEEENEDRNLIRDEGRNEGQNDQNRQGLSFASCEKFFVHTEVRDSVRLCLGHTSGEKETHLGRARIQPFLSTLFPTQAAISKKPFAPTRTRLTSPATAAAMKAGRGKNTKWWLPSRADEARAVNLVHPRESKNLTVMTWTSCNAVSTPSIREACCRRVEVWTSRIEGQCPARKSKRGVHVNRNFARARNGRAIRTLNSEFPSLQRKNDSHRAQYPAHCGHPVAQDESTKARVHVKPDPHFGPPASRRI